MPDVTLKGSKILWDFFRHPLGVLEPRNSSRRRSCDLGDSKAILEGYGNDNPGAKSQGMKRLMAGGGVALIGTTLVRSSGGLPDIALR